MIGIDWGTSSFRAFRIGEAGVASERRAAPRGILAVEGGDFDTELRRQVGDWIAGGERLVLMSGMIGSRQGWQEVPYVRCPAGLPEIAAGLASLACEGVEVRVVPGLACGDAAGTPEVMRGEETQILGVLAEIAGTALACLPGSHSKWARLTDGRIAGFETYFTGEAFAALRGHTILGRLMRDAPTDPEAFDRGLARAGEGGHLLHHLFGVRTLGLSGRLGEDAAASYLSGLLIGHEVRAALERESRDKTISESGMGERKRTRPALAAGGTPMGVPEGAEVHLIGAASLTRLYARAIVAAGSRALEHGEDAAERGLARLGREVGWR